MFKKKTISLKGLLEEEPWYTSWPKDIVLPPAKIKSTLDLILVLSMKKVFLVTKSVVGLPP